MIVLNSPHKLLLMIFLLYNNDVTPELMGDLCFDVSLLLYENYVLKEGASGGCPEGGWVLPYMGYMGMCRCEGYGFQAIYSRIGYINQSIWVWYHFSGN